MARCLGRCGGSKFEALSDLLSNMVDFCSGRSLCLSRLERVG